MQHDPLYQYILLNIPRRKPSATTPPFMPPDLAQDPTNRHDDNRRLGRDPEPTRIPTRQRLGRLLVRLGRWVEGHRPAPPPALDPASARRPTTLEIAP